MLTQKHKKELLSSIPDTDLGRKILSLNFWSLSDSSEIDRLLQIKQAQRWKHGDLESGWAVAGVDPFSGERNYRGVQFKPDSPRFDEAKKRVIKYESVRKASPEPLFLDTGDTQYWATAREGLDPIWIVEGAKKAAALLALGVPAISIAGVDCAQAEGKLIESLKGFLRTGATVILGFDSDWLQKFAVRNAMKRLGRLLLADGINVQVASWDEQYKGIDDYLIKTFDANGCRTSEELLQGILDHGLSTYESWIKSIKGLDFEQSKRPGENGFTWNMAAAGELFPDEDWISYRGKLYCWVGTHYEIAEDDTLRRKIAEFAESIEIENKSGKITRPYARPSYVNEALAWVKDRRVIDSKLWNPPGINCTNGVVSWNRETEDFEFLPHSRERYFTHAPLVRYDPLAPTEACDQLLSALSPEFQEILLATAAAPIDLDYVRSKQHARLRMLILKGVGSNGKDAHRECISMIYGNQGVSSIPLSVFNQYDEGRHFGLAGLANSRLNWSSENRNSTNITKLDSLKSAVTGDPMQQENKGQDPRELKPKAVFIFNTNEIPRLSVDGESITSRVAIISYDKVFKSNPSGPNEIKADPRFKHDPGFISREILPALLNRMLTAFKNMVRSDQGIDYSACDAAFIESQIHNSHLFEFSLELGLVRDSNSTVQIGEVWNKLEDWYKNAGILEISPEGFRRWEDNVRPGDPWIKSARQLAPKLLDLFPQCKKITLAGNRQGLQGLRFDPAVAAARLAQKQAELEAALQQLSADHPVEAQPKAQPEAQPKAQPEAQPKAQPEAQPEAGPEAQPEADQVFTKVYPIGSSVQLQDGSTGVVMGFEHNPSINPEIVYWIQNCKPDLQYLEGRSLKLIVAVGNELSKE